METSEELTAPSSQPQCAETSERRLPADTLIWRARLPQMSHPSMVRKSQGCEVLCRVALLPLFGVSLQESVDPQVVGNRSPVRLLGVALDDASCETSVFVLPD
jgi:hypothetical protein